MSEIERVLQLAKEGKISKEDAVKLLQALSAGLKKLPESTWEHLFAMMDEGMSAEALAQVLEAGEDEEEKRTTFRTGVKINGRDVGRIVEEALARAGVPSSKWSGNRSGDWSSRFGAAKPTGATRLIKIEVASSGGDNVRVNIPVGLANFALKLIPKDAQKAMNEQGLDPETLQEMLRSDLPEGNLVDIATGDGNKIRISVQ
ncbi:MAG: SHOCT-like domain-containing protein [Deinococcales bacterium]